MDINEYVAVRELEQNHGSCWAKSSPLWVIAAVFVIGFFVYTWQKNCNEKVAFATGLANLDGRINCIAPQVTKLNEQMYDNARAVTGITVGFDDMKSVFGAQIGQLNNTVYYSRASLGSCFGGCNNGCSPNRVFTQTQTYTPGESSVTVTESCGNDRC